MSLFLFQKRNSLTDLESKFMIVKGEGWGGGVLAFTHVVQRTLFHVWCGDTQRTCPLSTQELAMT